MRLLSDMFWYQPLAIQRMIDRERQACLLVPGTGKTICGLTAFLKLKARARCETGLVVAPRGVVESETWSKEAKRWLHTSRLMVTEVFGSPEERLALLAIPSDIYVISFDNLIWLTNLRRLYKFDCIIFDELSKMKHAGTKRFKRMRSGWLMSIPIRFGLTGSPQGNHVMDLWGEMFMTVGKACGLGDTKEEFTGRYFNPIPKRKYQFKIRSQEHLEEIRALIKPHAFSLPKSAIASLQKPEVIHNPVELKMPKHLLEMEKTLRRELEIKLASGITLQALNASSLAQKIRMLSAGAMYTAGPEVEPRPWEEIHRIKLDALRDKVDELQGEPVLVFTFYKHSQQRILAEFGKVAQMMTGKAANLAAWDRGDIEVGVCHPLSIGHGVDGLQLHKGASNVIWFDGQFSRELYDQGNARIARTGNRNPFVVASSLLVGRTDKRIYNIVMDKGNEEADTMEYLELAV